MEFAMLEKQYMDAVEVNNWEKECIEMEIELQKKQNELREQQLKLQNWEVQFHRRQNIVTSNGIVIKKIFNA